MPKLSLAIFVFASSLFGFAQKSAPLPAQAALFHTVIANQQHIDVTRQDYICKEEDEILHLDSHGQTKKRETADYEVSFHGSLPARRLVAYNGTPLSGDSQRQVNSRITQELDKLRQQYQKDTTTSISIYIFLRASNFIHERRENFRGRRTIVFDFVPNPSFQPRSLNERVARLLSGTLWIDEQDKQVMALEAHLDKSFKIAGGLAASLNDGSSVRLEQTKINDEAWMPALADINLQARQMLFFAVHLRQIQHYYDYRKFRTEVHFVDQSIAPADAPPEPAPSATAPR